MARFELTGPSDRMEHKPPRDEQTRVINTKTHLMNDATAASRTTVSSVPASVLRQGSSAVRLRTSGANSPNSCCFCWSGFAIGN